MVADDLVGTILEAAFFFIMPGGKQRRPEWSKIGVTKVERRETDDLLRVAADGALTDAKERRLRELLQRQGYLLDGVSRADLAKIATEYLTRKEQEEPAEQAAPTRRRA